MASIAPLRGSGTAMFGVKCMLLIRCASRQKMKNIAPHGRMHEKTLAAYAQRVLVRSDLSIYAVEE